MAEANEEGSLSLIDFTEVEVAEGPLNLALTSLYFFLLVSFWCLLFRHIMRWPIRAQKKIHTKANVWKENATHFYNVKITWKGRSNHEPWSWTKKWRPYESPGPHTLLHLNAVSETQWSLRMPCRVKMATRFLQTRSSIRKIDNIGVGVSPRWRLNTSIGIDTMNWWNKSLHGRLRSRLH